MSNGYATETHIEHLREDVADLKVDCKKILACINSQPKSCAEDVGIRLNKRDEKIDNKVDKKQYYWTLFVLISSFSGVIGFVAHGVFG